MPLIQFDHLYHRYDDGMVALDDFCLDIEEGEIYGLLGPNGAGKSTAFRVLVGLLEPTSGRALLDGRAIRNQEREVYRTLGYLPDLTDIFDNYTIDEFLTFFCRCHEMPERQIKERSDELLQRFQLVERRGDQLKRFSKGMKQKASIMRALIHKPKVLVLDEPSSSLDPGSRRLLRDILEDEKKSGTTILISSHILPELSGLCTSLAILRKGQVVDHGRIEELIQKYQSNVAVYHVTVIERMDRALEVLRRVTENEIESYRCLSPNHLVFHHRGDEHQIANLLELFVRVGVRITGFERQYKNIEQIYSEVVNE